MNKIIRIKELVRMLNMYCDAYYNANESLISDKDFDKLYDELLTLEKETGIILSNSPTQHVGYEVKSALQKVKHSHLMMSLDKTKETKDLVKFMNRHECVLMDKMDGLTILLSYRDGKLIQAETRGNGKIGENITHNAMVFENIPLTIDLPGLVEFEGEAIITYEDFEKINASIKDVDAKYKNPRNLASGSVRQLNSKIAKERHLKFILWKVPTGMNHINSFKERLENARELGFDIVPFVTVNSAGDINGAIDGLKNVAKNLSYPIDGLVITYNDIKYGFSLGVTDKFPRHSFAFKFYDDLYETTLQDVEWTIGKSGQLTPTAVFEPVEIDGTEVSRASLHNVSIFKAFNMHVGDIITVYKSNMIIPQIKENLSKGNDAGAKLSVPQKCPYCGEPTIIIKENDSEVLMCLNAQCQGKLLGELCAFVGKKAHDIKGLSEATLSLMIHTRMVHSPIDLYHLEDKRKELTYFPKMGSKKVDNILKAIEESRNTTLEKFIVGLNIPLIGSRAAKDIAKHEEIRTREAKLIKPINTFIVDASENYDFTHIEGLGIERNNSIHNYFKENYDYVCAMASQFKFPEINLETEDVLTSVSLEGKKFCITGKLQKFTNRDALVTDIEEKGGKVVSGVTKATSYLITNDKTSGSSKNKKAAELNIPIISEEEYINLTKGN
ncbi:NAD-dependent DNA ligase LigA [Blautia intestinalis]|uniref:NAD-dependent DNA ligase LigA n=1 Tax=Blautia intestinalis TaxID=2763028 RepID=UPI0022E8DF26|nr:NAD-dependent DNA ligase LigA [Blautia intestinalis]